MTTMPTARRQHPAQTSLLGLPTADPAAAIIWETRTVKWPKADGGESWQFHRTKVKGHLFHVGRFPPELVSMTREPPPSRWQSAYWQLHAQFQPGGPMEPMSTLPGCETAREALILAESRIRGFLEDRRRQYD